MKSFYKLLLVLFLLPLISNAQSHYKPGYVVTLAGDTLKGFIDYKEWDKTPKNINFKSSLNYGPVESFTVKNAREFTVTGYEHFKSFTVRISQDQVELSNVKQGADTSFISGTIFLRLLTIGKNISLLNYTDNIKTRYYILDEGDGLPFELVYRVYYTPENNIILKTDNMYQVQLDYLVQKYQMVNPELERQISNSQYQDADLIKIVQGINGATSRQVLSQNRFGIRLYAGLGITNNIMSFTGALKFSGEGSIFPKISAGLDVLTNKNTQQIFLRAEFSLSVNQHSFSNGPDASGYSASLSNVVQQTISVSPQIIFNFYNSDHFKVFIDGGLSINVSSYNSYHLTENFSHVTSATTNEFPLLLHVWDSVPVKAGIVLNKKIEIYAGYAFSTILTNDDAFAGSLFSYQAGINYYFGK